MLGSAETNLNASKTCDISTQQKVLNLTSKVTLKLDRLALNAYC